MTTIVLRLSLSWIGAEAGDLSEVLIVEFEARNFQEQDGTSRADDGGDNILVKPTESSVWWGSIGFASDETRRAGPAATCTQG